MGDGIDALGMLNTRQTAAFLNCSTSQLQTWRVEGGGPQFVKFGKMVRYRKQDLIDFVERSLTQNTSGERRGCPGGRPRKARVEETTGA